MKNRHMHAPRYRIGIIGLLSRWALATPRALAYGVDVWGNEASKPHVCWVHEASRPHGCLVGGDKWV